MNDISHSSTTGIVMHVMNECLHFVDTVRAQMRSTSRMHCEFCTLLTSASTEQRPCTIVRLQYGSSLQASFNYP